MKCVLLSENLKKALSLVERSTGKDLTLPILGSFLIHAENGFVKIMGTNLEVGMEVSLRGTIQEAGKAVVPARVLTSFISTLPKDEKITFELKHNDLSIHTQTQKTTIKGFPQEDFPPFPLIKDVYTIRFKKIELLAVLLKSIISTSKNTIKPELASIYFHIEKDVVTVAATDGFRLSEEKIKPIGFSLKGAVESFLIPLKTCEELIKLLEYSDHQEIDFYIGKGEILIKYNETQLYSRLTEGKFPEYQQIIPKKFTTQVLVSRDILITHIRRASIFTNKLQGVSLSFDTRKNECTIESSNTAVGEYKASFEADIQGDDLTIVFNYHYLLDGLEGYNDQILSLGLNSESQPLVIHPSKRDQSLYIVMPMKGVV